VTEAYVTDVSGRDVIWQSQPKQHLFITCPIKEVMYGGRAGGGKSDGLMMKPIFRQLIPAHEDYSRTGRKSRGRYLLIRKSYNRLKDLIARCQAVFPSVDPGVRYVSNEHMFYFPCGYRYELGHLEGPGDEQNYHGQEFSGVGIDQGEEIPFEQFMFLKSRLRTSDPVLKDRLILDVTANPGGPHGAWVKERYVEANRDGMKPITTEVTLSDGSKEKQTRIFIPAGLKDNKYLGRDYDAALSELPEHLRRMLRDGDWDVTVGAFFSNSWDKTVHVKKTFTIPESWQKFRSGDYGYNAPASIGWWAIDHDGNLVRFRELYVKNHTGEMLARRIMEIEQDLGLWDPNSGSLISGPLDPACWNKTGLEGVHGPSIAETMMTLGVRWYRADNNRIPGWNEMRKRLMARSGPRMDVPGVYCFENCKDSIRTIPSLLFDEHKPEDVDTKGEDHAADEWRYAAMSRPMATPKPVQRDDDQEEDELAYMRNKKRGGRMGYGGH
jgi:hypothetical protein